MLLLQRFYLKLCKPTFLLVDRVAFFYSLISVFFRQISTKLSYQPWPLVLKVRVSSLSTIQFYYVFNLFIFLPSFLPTYLPSLFIYLFNLLSMFIILVKVKYIFLFRKRSLFTNEIVSENSPLNCRIRDQSLQTLLYFMLVKVN